jgi:hypothetical protein
MIQKTPKSQNNEEPGSKPQVQFEDPLRMIELEQIRLEEMNKIQQ